MITIKGDLQFIMQQHKRFTGSHKIARLVRRNKQWYLTLEVQP